MRWPPGLASPIVQLRNFIAVLIDQDRIALLPEIAKQLDIELNQPHRTHRCGDRQRPRAWLPSSVPTLLAEISRLTGKTVLPHYDTDAKLIGGVTVRVGSTIYDGSVRGQLQRIRQQLMRETRFHVAPESFAAQRIEGCESLQGADPKR